MGSSTATIVPAVVTMRIFGPDGGTVTADDGAADAVCAAASFEDVDPFDAPDEEQAVAAKSTDARSVNMRVGPGFRLTVL